MSILQRKLTVMLIALLLAGCASTSPQRDHEAGDAPTGVDGSNMSYYRNSDPEIEALHVRAYNLDLGIGVPQDHVKANELYQEAAYAGDPRSMMNYSINLASGRGTDVNMVEAFAWIDVARYLTQQSRDMTVKWRVRAVYDEMKPELTQAQLREADARGEQILKRVQQRR